MHGDLHVACFFHQDCHLLQIESSVWFEDTDYNAVSACFTEHLDIAADDLEFLVGVAEVAESWTDD